MENNPSGMPWQSGAGDAAPLSPDRPFFPSGGKEIALCALMLILSVLLVNFGIWGGLNLGFALAGVAIVAATTVYLIRSGRRPGLYSGALLLLSLVILAGFPRSDDAGVKAMLVLFLFVSVNLGLCLQAGQNRREPGGAASLLDAPRTLFVLGVGHLGPSFQGLRMAQQRGGKGSRRGGAIALGLLIAIPLVALLLSLLTSADAAFEGMLRHLPKFQWSEWVLCLFLGVPLGAVLYTRGAALRHAPRQAPAAPEARKGLSPLTVNTVLLAVCAVFVVYLLSQLAYFVGGFSGLLPEGFTVAEYARRGFFEIAWLCAINLAIIAGAAALLGSRAMPLLTKLTCLFIGLFSLFLVSTAAAKMVMYIRSFGLTRLRVLTTVILLWLAITLMLACVRLFVPKLPYMKGVLLAAMIIGAAVLWVDVDTQVARYNVSAYQSGALQEVDVRYLGQLNAGAVPYLVQLAENSDPETAANAAAVLEECGYLEEWVADFRSWNYPAARAEELVKPYVPAE